MDYLENAEAVIYELSDGCEASTVIYDKEATKLCDIKATRDGNKITVSYTKTDKTFKVRVSGTDICAVANAGTTELVIEL